MDVSTEFESDHPRDKRHATHETGSDRGTDAMVLDPRVLDAVALTPSEAKEKEAVPLSTLRVGDRGRLAYGGSGLEQATLAALGLSTSSPFRVARVGNPWIVQVHATRIGLSDVVARGLWVLPESP